MGKKAKIKKERKQQQTLGKVERKYDQTQFVKQFENMGYQVQIDPKLLPKTNRGNVAPEIPQNRIEPQL